MGPTRSSAAAWSSSKELRKLVDLLTVVKGWDDRRLSPEAPVLYRHHVCGEVADVELRCGHRGEPMRAGDVDVLPGLGVAGTAT